MEKPSHTPKERDILEQSDILDNLDIKLFRVKENNKKANYILQETSLPSRILSLSNTLSTHNGYHNFGHQLGVAEACILLGKAHGCTQKQIDLLVMVALFHDAGHTGIKKHDDEEQAYQLVRSHIDDAVFEELGIDVEEFHRLILATKFEDRGTYDDELAKIIQDADLATLGYGPWYVLYSSMGMVEEFGLSPVGFVERQEEFLVRLGKIDKHIFLSEAAKKVFVDPYDTMSKLRVIDLDIIDKAYVMRKEDLTLEEFCMKLDPCNHSM